MLFSQFLADFRIKTGTDDYTFERSEVCTILNSVIEDFSTLATLPGVAEDYFGRVFQRDLTAGVRKYDFPVDLQKIKRVDILINGELEDATEKDMSSIKIATVTPEAKIQELMRGRKPVYEIFGRSIYLYTQDPIVTTTLGLTIHGMQYPSPVIVEDFESTRDMSEPRDALTQGIPRGLHMVALMRAVIDYKESRDKPKGLTQEEQNYVGKLSDVLKTLRVFNTDRRYKMSEPNDGYKSNASYSPLK